MCQKQIILNKKMFCDHPVQNKQKKPISRHVCSMKKTSK